MPGIIPIFFWRFHGFSQLAQSSWRLGLILSRAAAEIARARGICHRSGSRTLWRHAGSLTNAGAPDERVSGVLIKRCGPLEAVTPLELQKRPLCLRAYNAIQRAIVESDSVKLYLRPSDVVFREFAASSQCCEDPGAAVATSSALTAESRAAPPNPNTNTEAVPRINFLIIVISRVLEVSEIV